MDDTDKFIEWCQANGRQEVVQSDLDKRSAQAYGASIFSQPILVFRDKRNYYRNEYLKSEHWRLLRIKKLSAYPICEKCQKVEATDAHHLRYKSLYDVQLYDLLSLCRRCHDYEHALLEVQQQNTWDQRIRAAASILRCQPEHLEQILETVGVTSSNLNLIVSAGWLKFGMFKAALSSRPIVPLRMAFMTLCGKRNFTSTQNPPVCVAV